MKMSFRRVTRRLGSMPTAYAASAAMNIFRKARRDRCGDLVVLGRGGEFFFNGFCFVLFVA